MIVQLEKNTSDEIRVELTNELKELGIKTHPVVTQDGDYLVGILKGEIDIRRVGKLKGVKDVHRVTEAYKLVSSQWKVGKTAIDLGDGVRIGDGSLALMAGPCSIESEEQVHSVVKHLKENGVRIMRGGVFKPRSSPYSFRGMGLDGLKIFSSVCRENGIKIITEVMQVSQIREMYDYIDVFQVGARNSQNFNLLDGLGEVDKPVLVKRGMSGSIDELLQSAEYIFSAGNERLLLCERGIRTFETVYRNTFDINAIPVLKEKSHLPVIADPSHGIGIRSMVPAVAYAACAAGADGIIYEVHETPEKAASDGAQTLSYEESTDMLKKLKALHMTL